MKLEKMQIPRDYDIVVAGGGLAGVMAAVSAAKAGLKTAIIEKYGFLGGMAASGLVCPFMHYRESGSGNIVNAGLFTSVLDALYAAGGTSTPQAQHFSEEHLKLVLDRMTKAYGIDVYFHAKLCDAALEGGRITRISVATMRGMCDIGARFFIDATGNADLAAFAGLEFDIGREEDGRCQPVTLFFKLANVDRERFDAKLAQRLFAEFREAGKIRNPRENILWFRDVVDNTIRFNTTRMLVKDPTDPREMSDAEMTGREQVFELADFLRANIPGMERAQIIETAPETGIRESRRVRGEYQLTADDLLATKKFGDSIARGAYCIDIHNPAGTGTYIRHIPDNDYYTIPYRSLLTPGAGNLLVAGRPISATHEAHAAIRIMPITSCIGEAAGCAAALAIRGSCAARNIDVSSLRAMLQAAGALI